MHVERFVAGRVFQEQEAGIVDAAAFAAAHKARRLRVASPKIPRRHAVFVVNAAVVMMGRSDAVDKVDHHSPTRGDLDPPYFQSAQALETRTQQELVSLPLPWRSQRNLSFTRPYLSVQMLAFRANHFRRSGGQRVFGQGVCAGRQRWMSAGTT